MIRTIPGFEIFICLKKNATLTFLKTLVTCSLSTWYAMDVFYVADEGGLKVNFQRLITNWNRSANGDDPYKKPDPPCKGVYQLASNLLL